MDDGKVVVIETFVCHCEGKYGEDSVFVYSVPLSECGLLSRHGSEILARCEEI